MDRQEEVRALLQLTPAQMLRKAKGRLVILKDLDSLHRHIAESMVREIKRNNKARRPTRLIIPVGPTGQYPILAEIINNTGLSLRRCHLFFMDEYCDDGGYALPNDHPLSFKGVMQELFFKNVDRKLLPPKNQIVFPDHNNIGKIEGWIEKVGGIDTCYGGIGVHGHVAFNEPERNVKDSGPRLVYLNDFTVTINAVRAHVGGNLENFPRKAVTLGMRQILGARMIRLYCRNGGPYDWANTILRIALFAEPGSDYPVTYIRDKDCVIVTDEDTARVPDIVL